jgi:hypothetical protein
MTKSRIIELACTAIGIAVAIWYGHQSANDAKQQAEWIANQNHDNTVAAVQKTQDMVNNDHGFIMDQELRLLKIDNSIAFIYGKMGWNNMSSDQTQSSKGRRSVQADSNGVDP